MCFILTEFKIEYCNWGNYFEWICMHILNCEFTGCMANTAVGINLHFYTKLCMYVSRPPFEFFLMWIWIYNWNNFLRHHLRRPHTWIFIFLQVHIWNYSNFFCNTCLLFLRFINLSFLSGKFNKKFTIPR